MEPRRFLQGNSSRISLNDTIIHIGHGNRETFVSPQQDTSCPPSVNHPTKETFSIWAALTTLFQRVFRGLIVSEQYYFCSTVHPIILLEDLVTTTFGRKGPYLSYRWTGNSSATSGSIQ